MSARLITADERARLLIAGQARAAGRDIDPVPVVRLFTPDAHAIWLLAALDPADGDTAWGLIDLGIGITMLGTVKLSDLAGIAGPWRWPVLRDRYFKPARSLFEYAELAEWDGSIPD
ncbi:putative lipoprotein [Candidatus Burkholderia humilis]|nr:putative lipoprotein [Candidatus Burkholderia humilis]